MLVVLAVAPEPVPSQAWYTVATLAGLPRLIPPEEAPLAWQLKQLAEIRG